MDGQTRSKYGNNQSKVHLRWYVMAIQIPARKAPGQLFSVTLCFYGLLFEQILVLGNYPSLNRMTVLRALPASFHALQSKVKWAFLGDLSTPNSTISDKFDITIFLCY